MGVHEGGEPLPEDPPGELGAELHSEINCFFISGSRHDRDRVEIQLGFDGLVQSLSRRFDYDVDMIMFVPKTLGINELGDTNALRQEFQSYVRLHTHASNPNSETSFLRVRERLAQLREKPSEQRIRILAIEFEAFLRGQTKRVRKEIRKLESEPVLLPLVISELEATKFLVENFREFLRERDLYAKPAEEIPAGIDRDLVLLNEYLSHVYVQYLSALQQNARAHAGADTILLILETMGLHEAELRMACKFLTEQRQGPQSSIDEDLYLRRIGVLKKYFQRTIFVDSVGRSLQSRLYIPVYAIVAAMAASWAIMIQIYQASTLRERLGINSIALISIGVCAYIVKDLFKDFGRRYLFTKSRMIFADYEKILHIRRRGKTRELGRIHEYMKTGSSGELPESLRRARYSVRGGEMETYLEDDILHFRKKVSLDLGLLEVQKEFPWGLREIVRIRFDRLLASMEDPFKAMHLVSKTGATAVRQGHRVYHVYLAAWIQKANKGDSVPVKDTFKAFRVTLDKTGVLACDSVKWKQEFGVPEIPH